MVFALLEGPDLIIVLLIVVVIFGGSKIPKLARSLGEAQREFRLGHEDTAPVVPAQPDPPAVPPGAAPAPVRPTRTRPLGVSEKG